MVKRFLEAGARVWVLDNLEGGNRANLEELEKAHNFEGLVVADVAERGAVSDLFRLSFNLCIHLAAQSRVQVSLEEPYRTFRTNLIGSQNVLEEARRHRSQVVMVGTCMVYASAQGDEGIGEDYPIRPASPYAASKLAADILAEGYFRAFGLPVVILRPFNTYGPFQRSDLEGGVVSIFLRQFLEGKELTVFGDGSQTRDLMYVEDCSEFIYRAATSREALGQVINAGYGKDISIRELALLIARDEGRIKFVPHPHSQSEIMRLICNRSKAKALLGWEPKIGLKEGIFKTLNWMRGE